MEANEFLAQSTQQSGSGDAIGMVGMVVIFAIYLYMAYMHFKVANLTGHSSSAWMAFVPIANIFLLCKTAGKPAWWFILCLVPFVNFIVIGIMWAATAKNVSQPPLWGWMTMVPFINFVALYVMAFKGKQAYGSMQSPVVSTESQSPQPVG
ncbi:MAG: DUF5684 domain-containing protein [Candidatus Zixiibacteriota bacterium]